MMPSKISTRKGSIVCKIFVWIDPSLANFHIDMDRDYGVNWSDISVKKNLEPPGCI